VQVSASAEYAGGHDMTTFPAREWSPAELEPDAG
jgi:hypothetical protein